MATLDSDAAGNWRDAFLQAILTGDEEVLQELGAEYGEYFAITAEILDELSVEIWDQAIQMTDYERGKIIGRVVGEVGLAVASAGPIAERACCVSPESCVV